MDRKLYKSLVSEDKEQRLEYYMLSQKLKIGGVTLTTYGIEICGTPLYKGRGLKSLPVTVPDITPDYEKITELLEELCEGLFDPVMLPDIAVDKVEEWGDCLRYGGV